MSSNPSDQSASVLDPDLVYADEWMDAALMFLEELPPNGHPELLRRRDYLRELLWFSPYFLTPLLIEFRAISPYINSSADEILEEIQRLDFWHRKLAEGPSLGENYAELLLSLETYPREVIRKLRRMLRKELAMLQVKRVQDRRAFVQPAWKDSPESTLQGAIVPETRAERGQRKSKEQANETGMELAKKMGMAWFNLSMRRQAALIGCHLGTWKKTEFYKTCQRKGKSPPPNSSRRAVALPSDHPAPADQDALAQLIAEAEADGEQSPLDSDNRRNLKAFKRV